MSAIGRGKWLRCCHKDCRRRRPYWHSFCAVHRIEEDVNLVDLAKERTAFSAVIGASVPQPPEPEGR